MRATVLICDLLYVWAVIMFTRTIQATRSTRTQVRPLTVSLVWGVTLRFKRKESHDSYSPDATGAATHRLWAFPIQLCHARLVWLAASDTPRLIYLLR